MNEKTRIGSRVKKARKASKLSQEGLAEKVNVSVTTISRLETGRQMVSVEKLLEIAEVLDCGVNRIFSDITNDTSAREDDPSVLIAKLLDQCTELQKFYVADQVELMLKYWDEIAGNRN